MCSVLYTVWYNQRGIRHTKRILMRDYYTCNCLLTIRKGSFISSNYARSSYDNRLAPLFYEILQQKNHFLMKILDNNESNDNKCPVDMKTVAIHWSENDENESEKYKKEGNSSKTIHHKNAQ